MSRQAIQIGLLSLLLIFLPGTIGAAVVEQLIVVINGEPYTLSNVNTYAKSKLNRDFPSGDLTRINQPDQEVLEGFITEKLLEAEAREAGISITEDEINRYIEQVKKNNRLSDDDLKTALGREGQTLASYKVSVKAEMEKSEIIDRQVRRRVNITDEDVERYYKLNSKNYRGNERARIRHILLSLPEKAPPDQVQSVMAKAKMIYQRIGAGRGLRRSSARVFRGRGQSGRGRNRLGQSRYIDCRPRRRGISKTNRGAGQRTFPYQHGRAHRQTGGARVRQRPTAERSGAAHQRRTC